MTRDDIIRMAREAGMFKLFGDPNAPEALTGKSIERFAALVAAHTLANIDPSKFMSYQEGYEAAVAAEREACAKVADLVAREIDDTNGTATYIAAAIRARGEV
jgi:hypothetical protein